MALQKCDCESTNGCDGDGSAEHRLPIDSCVNSAADASDSHRYRRNLAEHSLDEDVPVNTIVAVAAMLGFELGLGNDEVNQVRSELMQRFQLLYRQNWRVCLLRMNRELITVVAGSLSSYRFVSHIPSTIFPALYRLQQCLRKEQPYRQQSRFVVVCTNACSAAASKGRSQIRLSR
jgi:hypothetical protein